MSTGNPVRDDIAAALGADYEILRELGRGGASVVYLARDRVLGREVAVKVVLDAQASDPEAIARFEREARTLASLQHPNIVMLYSARQLPGGTLALVMQHGDWTTLKARIRELGPLPIDEVQQALHDIASALVYLHRHGVIHRDIKPENIFIEASGRALISDFGIAKTANDARTSVTLTGVVIGTPAYMAPEQIDGGELTGRSDLYSLGMVGYEMLTGKRPWEGENLFGVIYKQKTEQLPSLIEARPDTPEHLRLLIERATEKDASARWGDATEFLAQLSGSEVPRDLPREPRATALVPASQAPVIPTRPAAEFPTLEIDQAALASAFADEGRAELKRRRGRRQRFMTAAVALLLLTGGAGALAFSGREAGDELAAGDRLAALATSRPTDPGYPLAEPSDIADPGALLPADSVSIPDDIPPAAPASGTATPASGGGAAAARSAGGQSQASRPAATTPRSQPSTPTPTPARTPIQRNITASAATPGLEIAQEDVIRSAPPALIPALSVARTTGTEPPVAGGQVLQPQAGARAGSAGAPQLRNRERVQQLLAERYPTDLRARGIGGTSVLTVLVAPDGRVQQSSLVTSSGNERLDQAAAAIVGRMLFEHPADAPGQAVWISVPLTFSPR